MFSYVRHSCCTDTNFHWPDCSGSSYTPSPSRCFGHPSLPSCHHQYMSLQEQLPSSHFSSPPTVCVHLSLSAALRPSAHVLLSRPFKSVYLFLCPLKLFRPFVLRPSKGNYLIVDAVNASILSAFPSLGTRHPALNIRIVYCVMSMCVCMALHQREGAGVVLCGCICMQQAGLRQPHAEWCFLWITLEKQGQWGTK